jgi:hypothetical protein
MGKKTDTQSWKERLRSVPKSFVAYKKDSVSAIDEMKKERKLLAPLIFCALLFLSCTFIIGAHYRGVDDFIAHSKSPLNDYGLLKYVSVFSIGATLLFGLVMIALLFIIYVFTRFVCVKLFSRGLKAKDVLLDGIIEFGMNSITWTVFFLLGGVLSNLFWWSFFLIIAFFTLFFIIMLIRSIFDAVDRTKQKSLMVFVMSVCIFISLLLINAFMTAVLGYSLMTIAQGVQENINHIWDNVKVWLDSFIKSLYFFK